jgi:hypothetical protein
VADLVNISQLSSLISDQYRLMQHFEEHRDQLPAYDAISPEACLREVRINDEPWSVQAMRTGWECCHRGSGRTVVLRPDLPSPFDFHPSTLLRFVLSLDEHSQLNEIVIDNWILKYVRSGRLVASRHQAGYFSCA